MRTPQLADNLRRAVLQAAIEGKLNDRTNENARSLLAQIQEEKNRLIQQGRLKKSKPLPPIAPHEIPFSIPENWVWVKLGEIASKITDGSHNPPPKREAGIPILSAANIFDQKIQFSSATRWINEEEWEVENKRTEIQPNDILLTIVGTIGRTAVVENNTKFALQRSVAVIKPICANSFYLSHLLQSPFIIETMMSVSKGTAQKGIYLNSLKELSIPLPPLTEQQQIVAKLNQLLSEIDNLKTQEQALLAAQNAFPKKLRAALLQAAVQGELNERTDEDARDLLTAIQTEKTALQKNGKLKKDKPLAAINEEEIPFAIPENWIWVRLSNLCYSIPSKPYQILQKETQTTGIYPVVSQSKNMIDGYSNEKDKLFSEVPVIIFGDHTRVIKLIDFEFIVGADGTKILKPILTNEKYIEFALKALTINMVDRGYSRHFQFIKDLLIPLPPLAEQQQIVAKLEALLAEIDTLENAA